MTGVLLPANDGQERFFLYPVMLGNNGTSCWLWRRKVGRSSARNPGFSVTFNVDMLGKAPFGITPVSLFCDRSKRERDLDSFVV